MPSNREVERALGAELLEALRHQANTQTEWLERLAGQLVNHTLEVWSGVIPAEGYLTRSYGVAAGSIQVTSFATTATAHTLTVSSSGPSAASTAPTGTGTHPVPAGTSTVVALASRQFTIYGPAGDLVAFQVFTSGITPVTLVPASKVA